MDKLLYSYLGAWTSNVLEYSRLFPNSLILHKAKKGIINDGILYGGSGIPCITGNSLDTRGIWTGTSDDVTEVTEGVSIIYIPLVDGGETITTLNINNTGAVQVNYDGNKPLTNQSTGGCPILLTFTGGKWKRTDYNNNDVNLINNTSSTTSYYLTMTNEKSGELYSYSNSYLYFSNNTLYSPNFNGEFIGNSSTTTKLKSSRKINGTSFDGSQDITTSYWGYERKFNIKDWSESHTGETSYVNGYSDIVLKLPSTITADLLGNSYTATKIANPKHINGTLFDGSQSITTAYWGNARDFKISDNSKKNTGPIISVHGDTNIELQLPQTLQADIEGYIYPQEDLSYNIGSPTLRYDSIYASKFIGRANTIISTKNNNKKFYFTGVETANGEHFYDDKIYTSTIAGNLHSDRLFLNISTENNNYRLYVNGDGYINGDISSKKFITIGSSNQYVVLGDGTTKPLSDFKIGDYLPLTGGTMTGDILFSNGTNTYKYPHTGNSGLFIGDNTDLTSNKATTNGNTYLTLKLHDTYWKHNIIGGTGITVESDSNGKITITNTLPNTHWTSDLYIGDINVASNAIATDPYLKFFENSTLRHQYQIKAGTNISVSSDINGNITISNTLTSLSHTHQIKINNNTYTIPYTGSVDCGWYIEKLDWWTSGSGQNVNDITSGTTFVYTDHGAPTNGTIAVFSSRNNSYQLQIQSSYSSRGYFYYRSKNGDNSTWQNWTRLIDEANYTSYVDYHLYIGSSSVAANASVTNPYLKLYNISTLYHQYQIIGGGDIGVTSDVNGNITISGNNNKVTQNLDTTNSDYRILFKYTANDTNETNYVKYASTLFYNPSTRLLRNDGSLWLRPDSDATLKIYSGKVTDGYSDGFIKLQTSIDGTDGETHSYPGSYQGRCVIFLQPRGGEVYIGKDITSSSTSADTTYKLNVGGHANFDGNIWARGSDRYIRIGPQNGAYCHYETNAGTSHWFNKRIDVDGDIYLYGTSTRMQMSNGYVYANGFNHNGINSNDYVILAAGSYKQWTIGNTANALVSRDGNGYVYASYYNSDISDENSITIGSVYVRNNSDNWIRRMGLSDFVSQINSNDIVSFTKSLKVTNSWMDADIDITTSNFPKGNGTYVVMIDATSISNGTDLWPSIYSGVMTIYTSGTNGSITNEVILHRDGHEDAKRLYLRTCQRASSNSKLQISSTSDFSQAYNLIFKFRKLI